MPVAERVSGWYKTKQIVRGRMRGPRVLDFLPFGSIQFWVEYGHDKALLSYGPPACRISTDKHWMGLPQQEPEERVLVDNGAAGACGSYSPRPTLVLDSKPVEKHGSEVPYRSVMTSAPAAISFRSLLAS